MPPRGSPPTWTVATSDVPSSVLSLNDADRGHPVLIVSVASDSGKPRVVPEQLLSAVASTGAQVVVFTDMAAAQAFSDTAAGWNTYGGAVRLVAAPSAPDPGGLFLTFPDTAPELTIARIVRRLTHPTSAPTVPIGVPRVTARAAPWIPTPAQLPRRPAAPPTAPSQPPSPDPNVHAATVVPLEPEPVAPPPGSLTDQDLEPGASTPSPEPAQPPGQPGVSGDGRAADLDVLVEQLDAERAARARTVRELDELYEELQRRDDAVADSEDALYRVPVFADPARQFRHELDLRLLHTIDEVTRNANPPVQYELGPRWLDDLNDLARTSKVRRTKVLDTVVSLLLNRAHTVPGLSVHQLRTSAGGDSAFVRRDDGAIAWRASLQSHAPAARRLMWWSCPDGTVELARVARHDDLQMP